jgi:hypothetical protein
MKKILPLILGVAILVGGGAFYGGMKYAQAKSPRGGMRAGGGQFQTFTGGPGGGGPGGRAGGARGGMGGFVSGDILSNDGKTLTIKMRDGGSKIVLLGASTEVSKFVAGTPTDLEVGKTVMVVGKPNDDGSVTAQSVQLRPPMAPPTGGQDAPKPAGQ